VDDRAPILADLPAHLVVGSLDAHHRQRLLAEAGSWVVFGCGGDGAEVHGILRQVERNKDLSRIIPPKKNGWQSRPSRGLLRCQPGAKQNLDSWPLETGRIDLDRINKIYRMLNCHKKDIKILFIL